MSSPSLTVFGPGAPSREVGKENKRLIQSTVFDQGLRVARIIREIGAGKLFPDQRFVYTEEMELESEVGHFVLRLGMQTSRHRKVVFDSEGNPHRRLAIFEPGGNGVATAVHADLIQTTGDMSDGGYAQISNPAKGVERLRATTAVTTNVGSLKHDFVAAAAFTTACIQVAEGVARVPKPASEQGIVVASVEDLATFRQRLQ